MKNLIISAVFPPEPIVSAKLSYDIAIDLSLDNQVEVIAPNPSRPFGYKFVEEKPENKNFELIYANSFICPQLSFFGRLRESFSFGYCSYKYIKKNYRSIDKIYANTWPLFAQFFTVYASKKFNIPLVLHIQDIYPESFTSKSKKIGKFVHYLLLPLDKYILRNTSQIIAISQRMKKYLAETRNINLDKIEVINNWQNEEEFINQKFTDEKKVTHGIFTFMYLGNIGPVAGVDLLIDAFINSNLKDARLVIAGSGSMKESLEKKAKKQSKTSIEFWDVPAGKVPEIQSKADVMLLPIKKGAASSSIPSKLPAYMFSEKPIIVCADNDSDTALAIKDSNCGWVIEPENTIELVNKMKDVSSLSQEKLKMYGTNGYLYAIANFSRKSNLKKIITIITSKMP